MLYVGEGGGAVIIGEINPFGDDPSFEVMPHEKKGGLRLNDYLTYNCLENQVCNWAFTLGTFMTETKLGQNKESKLTTG